MDASRPFSHRPKERNLDTKNSMPVCSQSRPHYLHQPHHHEPPPLPPEPPPRKGHSTNVHRKKSHSRAHNHSRKDNENLPPQPPLQCLRNMNLTSSNPTPYPRKNLQDFHPNSNPPPLLYQVPHYPHPHPHPQRQLYIITYSTHLLQTPTSFTSLLHDLFPPPRPIPHLYTIFARKFAKPPKHLCAMYSGISHEIQDVVMRDSKAREAVQRAVGDVLAFLWNGVGEGKVGYTGFTGNKVAISVGCPAGTHRSVAAGEIIGKEVLRESKESVGVRICHVHLVKMERDPEGREGV